MRSILLWTVVCLAVSASPTTVTGIILGPDRRPAACTVRVSSPVDFTTPDGKLIKAGIVATKSTDANGMLSIPLEATTTSTPSGFAYNVNFSCGPSAKWLVPASVAPVDLSVVTVAVSPPAPPATIALSQIAAGGASKNQVLCFDGTNWTHCDASGGSSVAGVARYGVDFTNTLQVVVPGAAHKFANSDLLIRVYDSSRKKIEADESINPSTYDVTVSFARAQSGHIVIESSSNRYANSFTNQTQIVVLGSDHKMGSSDLEVALKDASGKTIDGDVAINPSTYDVTISFAQPQSGRYIIQ